MKTKFGKSISVMIVCVILGTIISWQFQSITNNKSVLNQSNKRLEEVADELIMERKNNENMQAKIDQLQKDVLFYKNTQGDYDSYKSQLQKELNDALLIAGMVDVKGKGLIIKMDKNVDSVRESDILTVLNELRASDVQAISINDERIIATSEIRGAGGYFIINGKQILPPIEIKAIADPVNVENALSMTGGVLYRLKEIIKVEIKKADEVIIPKVRDDGTVIKTNLLTPVTQ